MVVYLGSMRATFVDQGLTFLPLLVAESIFGLATLNLLSSPVLDSVENNLFCVDARNEEGPSEAASKRE